SAQAMLWVSRAVKSHATVLLTGDGGDDVFLGYPFFRNAWKAQQLAGHIPAGATAMWPRVRPLVPLRRLRSFFDFATGGIGSHARAHDGLPYYQRRRLLGERLAGLTLPVREVPASLDSARDLLGEVFRYH